MCAVCAHANDVQSKNKVSELVSHFFASDWQFVHLNESCWIFWSAILETQKCTENGQWPPVIFGSTCTCTLYVMHMCTSVHVRVDP